MYEKPFEPLVALFGSCGPTSYRQDILIPILRASNIPYFDPQVLTGAWQPDMAAIEDLHLSQDAVVTWTITADTPSLGSLREIKRFLQLDEAIPRPVVVYLNDASHSDNGSNWQRSRQERHMLADELLAKQNVRRVSTISDVAIEAIRLYNSIL